MESFFSHHISLERLCKEHLDEICPFLRWQDQQEMWAAYRLPAREALALCWKHSSFAVAMRYRGCVAAVAGVEGQTLLGGRGCVWSWTAEAVLRCPKSFWQVSCRLLQQFQQLYPMLYAACDERYLSARRYLLRLGARQAGEKFYLAGKETRFVPYVFAAPAGRIFINKEK